jgi:cytochrome P450
MGSPADLDEQLRQFDLYDPAHAANRWALFDRARDTCPVSYSSTFGGQYHVVSYEHVRFVLEHPELFSSAVPWPSNEAPVRLPPLDSDPPEHRDYRKLINPFLTRGYLTRSESEIRELAERLAANWVDRGSCEFVAEFAMPFTAEVLARVVFDETDQARLQRAVDLATAVATRADAATFTEFFALCAEYVIDSPTGGDGGDLLAAITHGSIVGRPMTRQERIGLVTMLFLGGLDTTRGGLGTIAHAIATTPGLEERLRDPEHLKRDVDELLRPYAPVAVAARTVLEPVTLGERDLKPGDRLIVHFDAANRDPGRYARPGQATLEADRPSSVLFGHGIHRCVGMHLARLEIEIAFDHLLAHIHRLRVRPGFEVAYTPGASLGPEALELEFDRIR